MEKPVIAITMGDPAGIGAEITAKALANSAVMATCRPIVVGDGWLMEKALKLTGLEKALQINRVESVQQARFAPNLINVLDMRQVDAADFRYGQVSKICGEAAFRYVEKAIALAMDSQVDATVTNPINKEALNLSGHAFSGHTEIYAKLTGTRRYCMLLMEGDMLISHVSTHVSLRDACDRVKKDRVGEVIGLTAQAAKRLKGIENPLIAVAGLNPHCGENGLFGTEEIEEIVPAVLQAQQAGLRVEGPLPPDTVFSKLRGGWYDAVVAMYHDQGHIPLKSIGFNYNREKQKWDSVSGVNITLGLPIIRTSVDHGTAFDQAGCGTADAASLLDAIDAAAKLSLFKCAEST